MWPNRRSTRPSVSKERQAFGRAVGNFQSIAHALADLQTEIDSARLLAYRAAWLLHTANPARVRAPWPS